MNIVTINLTEANSKLAKVQGHSGRKPNSYENYTIGQLPRSLKQQLITVLSKVTDTEITDDLGAFSVRFDDEGDFKQCYPPTLVTNADGALCVRLGNTLAPLNLEGNEDVDVFAEMTRLSQYTEPCLIISYEDEEGDEYLLPLPIRMSKDTYDMYLQTEDNGTKAFKIRLIATMVTKGQFDKLAKIVLEGKVGSSKGSVTDIKTLPQNVDFPVIERSDAITTQYGQTWILTIEHDGEQYRVFAPSKIRKLLETGYDFSENSTITYKTNEKNHVLGKASNLVFALDEDEEESLTLN